MWEFKFSEQNACFEHRCVSSESVSIVRWFVSASFPLCHLSFHHSLFILTCIFFFFFEVMNISITVSFHYILNLSRIVCIIHTIKY